MEKHSNLKGTILEWDNGKAVKRGLFIPNRQIKDLSRQGRGLVYELDSDLNIVRDNGKKVVCLVTIEKCKVVGHQD